MFVYTQKMWYNRVMRDSSHNPEKMLMPKRPVRPTTVEFSPTLWAALCERSALINGVFPDARMTPADLARLTIEDDLLCR